MNFYAVETYFDGRPGRPPEIPHNARQLFKLERTRHRCRNKAACAICLDQKSLARGLQSRRSYRWLAHGLKMIVRNSAHMPQLNHDFATALMHSLGHLAPA